MLFIKRKHKQNEITTTEQRFKAKKSTAQRPQPGDSGHVEGSDNKATADWLPHLPGGGAWQGRLQIFLRLKGSTFVLCYLIPQAHLIFKNNQVFFFILDQYFYFLEVKTPVSQASDFLQCAAQYRFVPLFFLKSFNGLPCSVFVAEL